MKEHAKAASVIATSASALFLKLWARLSHSAKRSPASSSSFQANGVPSRSSGI